MAKRDGPKQKKSVQAFDALALEVAQKPHPDAAARLRRAYELILRAASRASNHAEE